MAVPGGTAARGCRGDGRAARAVRFVRDAPRAGGGSEGGEHGGGMPISAPATTPADCPLPPRAMAFTVSPALLAAVATIVLCVGGARARRVAHQADRPA